MKQPSVNHRLYPEESRTMGIVEPLTEKHPQTVLGAYFRTMHILKTYKTTIGRETEVSVGTHQARQSVEGDAVHSKEDGGRKA
jgi:hypothetical protein